MVKASVAIGPFKGRKGPKTAVVLPRHKVASGQKRKRLNQLAKLPPIVLKGPWG